MRQFLIISLASIALSACNTVDGIGKDFGAVGQSFGNLFDSSVRTSRAMRDSNNGRMQMPPSMASGPGMNGPYGGGAPSMGMNGGMNNGMGGGGMPPQFPPYGGGNGGGHSQPGAYGAGYGGGPAMNNASGYNSGMSYGYGGNSSHYQAQPRPPAMPYYY